MLSSRLCSAKLAAPQPACRLARRVPRAAGWYRQAPSPARVTGNASSAAKEATQPAFAVTMRQVITIVVVVAVLAGLVGWSLATWRSGATQALRDSIPSAANAGTTAANGGSAVTAKGHSVLGSLTHVNVVVPPVQVRLPSIDIRVTGGGVRAAIASCIATGVGTFLIGVGVVVLALKK